MAPIAPGSRWARLLPRRSAVVVHGVLLVIAAGLFLFVAHEVREGDHFALENAFMRSLRTTSEKVRPVGPSWLPAVARSVTALGGVVGLSLVVGLAAAGLTVVRRHAAAVFLVLTALGGYGLNEGLKQFYGRARPDPEFRWVEVESLSFPSGHAMSSAIVYLALVGLLTRRKRASAFKSSLAIAALVLCFLIGLSRVYLGVHYPTDVLGGWAAAVAWLEFCWMAEIYLGERQVIRAVPPC